MSRSLRAISEDRMGPILDRVHDRPYEIASIKLDVDAKLLQVPVQLRSRLFTSAFGTLLLKGAVDFVVHDRAQIETGDICRILWTDDGFLIEGSLPVDIRVRCRGAKEVELLLPTEAILA